MDIASFPAFKDFLTRTEESARREGFRFKNKNAFPVEDQQYLDEFALTVRSSAPDSDLRDDIDRAIIICESEAIRKVMVMTCKELGVWPAPDSKSGDKEYNAHDANPSLEQTAYALWMHEKSLQGDEVIAARHKKQTMTAFFIVDFAHFAGVPEASKATEGGKKLLNDFLHAAKNYNPTVSEKLKRTLSRAVKEWAPPNLKNELNNWIDYNWDAVLVGGIAFAAGMIVASLFAGAKRH
jgi:hypothetical protein